MKFKFIINLWSCALNDAVQRVVCVHVDATVMFVGSRFFSSNFCSIKNKFCIKLNVFPPLSRVSFAFGCSDMFQSLYLNFVVALIVFFLYRYGSVLVCCRTLLMNIVKKSLLASFLKFKGFVFFQSIFFSWSQLWFLFISVYESVLVPIRFACVLLDSFLFYLPSIMCKVAYKEVFVRHPRFNVFFFLVCSCQQ